MVMKKWSEKKCPQETHGYWNSEQHRNSVRIKDKNKLVSYFNVSLFGEPKTFLREIMGKIEASVDLLAYLRLLIKGIREIYYIRLQDCFI